jgi:hypothetical protein
MTWKKKIFTKMKYLKPSLAACFPPSVPRHDITAAFGACRNINLSE